MLIDSHCHLNCLDLDAHNGSLDNAVQAARDNGVSHMLCVSIDMDHFPEVLQCAETYDDVTASVGQHPNDPIDVEPTVEDLVRLANHPKVVAIGETGLDYFRSEGDLDWQRERFRTHIAAAKQTKKPLIIHTREAREDTIQIMREENAVDAGGVMHCFTETWEMAQQAMAMGFMISFSGIVTFKNAKELQDVARKVPLESMLIETDSPYLAPVPFRGKPNEPAYVKHVAESLAELRGVSFEEIAEVTTANYYQVFGK